LQHTATHCNTLQHTATPCNTLQHICNTFATHVQHIWRNQHSSHCNTLQHTATHCNTLRNTLQHIFNTFAKHLKQPTLIAFYRFTHCTTATHLQHICNIFKGTSAHRILQIHTLHQVATDTRSHVPLRRRAINIDIFRGFGIYCMVPSDLLYGPN